MIYGLHYKIKEDIKMKDTAIIYEWIENGKEHQKEISREDFYARQSKQYVEDTFAGSLPAFIAAFTQASKLTPEEADAIRRMIDQAEEK